MLDKTEIKVRLKNNPRQKVIIVGVNADNDLKISKGRYVFQPVFQYKIAHPNGKWTNYVSPEDLIFD